MTGIYDDNNANGTGQPPHVLAAWIQDQLADLQGTQARHLADLRAQLQSCAFEWDATLLAQSVSSLYSAGRELRFDELRHGWLARWMGKHKPAYARVVAAYERMVNCAQTLKSESAKLQSQYKNHGANAKRLVVGLEMEWKAMQSDVDQGVTWLQDMWAQLNAQREATGADPQLANLAEAGQAFTEEFKRMQSASSVARNVGIRMQELVDRRGALLELVRGDIEKFEKSWMPAVGRIAADAKAGRHPIARTADAADEHEELMKRLETSTEACAALQQQEHLMAQHLDMLRRELDTRR